MEDAIALHGRGDVTFIDVRDIRELEREGRVPGAFHCPRGMLEFWIDPQSPYHKPIFAEEKRFAGGSAYPQHDQVVVSEPRLPKDRILRRDVETQSRAY